MDYVKMLHIAKNKAGLNDDEYRALLGGASGVYSAKDVKTPSQYNSIRAAFATLGVSLPYDNGKRLGAKHRNSPLDKKAYALWCTLADSGQVKDRSWPAMMAFRKRHFGADIIRVDQQSHFVEILKQWIERSEENKEDEDGAD